MVSTEGFEGGDEKPAENWKLVIISKILFFYYANIGFKQVWN